MFNILNFLERGVTLSLIFLMTFVIVIGTIDLFVNLGQEMIKPPIGLLSVENLLGIFGFFFTILIGLELLETIKTYFTKEQIHVEIVFLVAMIAIARKVILLEVSKLDPLVLVGIASIIIALTAGYFMVKKAHAEKISK
ncbi:hypothetical protein AMJ44_15595 [candidate division WOR-1 bacterium DG_54_3]|uniref:Phosphate-starvation-inducible E-like protein n=1 Tax=candidate division WOR-1 bacterium DG_54_3 TaxID=1703775 RepID=A0A0S7XJ22_UNCSA|nr:MAG: hypothetical protein AMJ44_15595 [candidate division WOR-1 bacterium DG_54_3]